MILLYDVLQLYRSGSKNLALFPDFSCSSNLADRATLCKLPRKQLEQLVFRFTVLCEMSGTSDHEILEIGSSRCLTSLYLLFEYPSATAIFNFNFVYSCPLLYFSYIFCRDKFNVNQSSASVCCFRRLYIFPWFIKRHKCRYVQQNV